MSMITVSEVKTLLQISVTDYDTLLATLLPIVRDFVVFDLCQNTFKRRLIYIEATTISFDNGTAKISDSDSNFLENDFTNGIDIIVEGSISNDGLYEVASDGALAGSLELDFTNHSGGALVDEDAGESVTITRVEFPRGLKLPVSQLFSHLISQDQLKGVQSEQTGTYAITYLSDLPKSLSKKFQPFKKVSW